MFRSTLIDMRSRLSRTMAIVVAVVLGVAFFTASLLSGSVMESVVRGSVGNQLRGADIVVFTEAGSLPPELDQELSAIDGVRATEDVPLEYGQAKVGGATVMVGLGPAPQLPELRDQMPIEEGRLPAAPNEIMLTEAAQARTGAGIGDTFAWGPYGDLGEAPDYAEFSVVGIVSGGNSFGTNLIEAFAMPDQFAAVVNAPRLSVIVVQVEGGHDPASVRSDIEQRVPLGAEALTYDKLVDAEVQRMQDGSNVLMIGLVGFASIAMFAAGIVISNTFSISVAQRTRDLAMLRCIGADKRQVRRSLIFEALLLGVAASVVGVIIGAGLMVAGAVAFIDSFDADALLSPSWRLLVPVVAGVLLTLGSALGPARAATRVHPLQALRHAEVPVESARMSIVRITTSIAMVLAGGIILGGAMLWSLSEQGDTTLLPLLAGMLGGGLSFLGLLYGTAVFLPPIVAVMGHLVAMVFGMPAKIAAANTRRNPRRTASTATALMMGVTLIAMMTTGAASVQETWNDVIDEQAPIDLVIAQDSTEEAELPGHVQAMVTETDGVSTSMPVSQLRGEVSAGDGVTLGVNVVGVEPDQVNSVVRTDAFESQEAGQVLVGDLVASDLGIEGGETLTVSIEGESIDLTAQVVGVSGYEIYLTSQDFEAIAPGTPATGMWARLDDDASAREVIRQISDNIPEGDSVTVGGSASDRATFSDIVDQILMVVTGLLGVAVVIAIVGVGNTLNLSVLERTRETGMLRAMGLTTSQMRLSLAIEGALIAAIGGLLGLVAGSVYGWVGTVTMFGGTWDATLAYPIPRLMLILAIAVLAGVLASVLPARRANAVTPVEALATI